MRKLILATIILLLVDYSVNAQVYFQKKWDHTFGGHNKEILTSIQQTVDSGYILGGFTISDSSGDISELTRGGSDFWVVKTDSLGNKLWEKRFGGSFEDKLYTAEQTSDGGYIFGGLTTSDSSGDISQPTRGGMDYWIVKTNAAGVKVWDKRFGGLDKDQLTVVQQTSDHGYLLGGLSNSDSTGDVSQHIIGSEDFWIVKTDSNGHKLWDRRYGGSLTDELYSLQQTSDGGYILGGRTLSDTTGDVSQIGHGDTDYWMIKITSTGVKQWDKKFGGNNKDQFLYLRQTNDHGYILGGYTKSDQNGDVTEPSRDTSLLPVMNRGDIWIVKTDSMGNKKWDKRFGGHWVEDAFGYINETADGGFLMGSASYSNASGDKTQDNFGYEQSWIVKTDSAGVKLWDKTIFVDGEDEYAYPIETNDGCYVIANWSAGDSSGYKTHDSKGDYDFWIIKFCETNQPILPVANFSANFSTVCSGGCVTYVNQSNEASSYQWSFPGGVPSSSTKVFPDPVCYADPGSYSVTLIASNGLLSDTTTIQNIVTVLPRPMCDIIPIGDTLFSVPGHVTYQWFYNNTPLPLDTIYFMVASQNGDYVVSVIDSNNCPNSDTLFSFIVGIKEYTFNGHSISIYPNPASSEININGLNPAIDGKINIYDITGRIIYNGEITSSELRINIDSYKAGMYFIEAIGNNHKLFARFIKN